MVQPPESSFKASTRLKLAKLSVPQVEGVPNFGLWNVRLALSR